MSVFRWFGTRFFRRPFPPVLAQWNTALPDCTQGWDALSPSPAAAAGAADAQRRLHLPQLNEFIPDRFDLHSSALIESTTWQAQRKALRNAQKQAVLKQPGVSTSLIGNPPELFAPVMVSSLRALECLSGANPCCAVVLRVCWCAARRRRC